jgi:hypothetical protein
MRLQDVHSRSLEKYSALSGLYIVKFIPPLEVISVLNGAGISFMLVGAHGLGGWLQKPRATEAVDVIVATKHHKKAVKALLAAFPNLEAHDLPVVTRLADRET